MSDHEIAEKCLDYIGKNQTPYFGENGELFRGIKESHGVLYALAGFLAKTTHNSLSCLEIGSFAGASALTWAWCAETLFDRAGGVMCLDPWDEIKGNAMAPENSQYTTAYLAQIYEIFLANVKYAEFGPSITHHKTGIEEFQQNIPRQKFNVIYIDGDHAYESVTRDILIASEMLEQDGILCGDDLSLQADEVDVNALEEAINSKQQFAQDSKTGLNFHPGVTGAVWKTLGKVSKYGATWYMQKSHSNWKPIDLTGEAVKFPPHYPDIE